MTKNRSELFVGSRKPIRGINSSTQAIQRLFLKVEEVKGEIQKDMKPRLWMMGEREGGRERGRERGGVWGFDFWANLSVHWSEMIKSFVLQEDQEVSQRLKPRFLSISWLKGKLSKQKFQLKTASAVGKSRTGTEIGCWVIYFLHRRFWALVLC